MVNKRSRRDLRFIVDAMLKNIVSWLRILGYDTVYWSGGDSDLLEFARKEDRVILTMDRSLALAALRSGLDVVLIMKNDVSDILANLASRCGISLDFDPEETRCPVCNHVLTPIRNNVREEWVCPSCGKKYWKGSHWKNISKKIEEARIKIRCD